MKGDKVLSKSVLRRCFFAYSFPYFVWLFHIYPFLPKTQKELLQRKFRNELRLIHCYLSARATDLLRITTEDLLEEYVKTKYIKNKLERIEKSDLIRSPFIMICFIGTHFIRQKMIILVTFFRMKRIRLMSSRHQSLLLQWFEFLHT